MWQFLEDYYTCPRSPQGKVEGIWQVKERKFYRIWQVKERNSIYLNHLAYLPCPLPYLVKLSQILH